jgi:hypothetical protein
MIRFIIFHESLVLRGCLCVAFLFEKKREEHRKKLYLPLCNGKSLKVSWILTFLLGVCFI